jgi:DNA polymerase (family 10)
MASRLDRAAPADRLAIGRVLHEIGLRLKLQGASSFRARAFARGAEALFSLGEEVGTVIEEGRLQKLPGIGPGLARVIEEVYRTGRSSLLEGLRAEMPPGVLELSRLRSLRLPRIEALHRGLGVDSLDALEAACLAGRVREVKGFGPATEARLLDEIRKWRAQEGHLPLHRALEVAESLVAHLRRWPGVTRSDYGGTLRRRHETITELPLLATGESAEAALDALVRFPRVDEVVGRGERTASVRLENGLPVSLEWVRPDAYGSALVRLTGSDPHWRRLVAVAREVVGGDLGTLEDLEVDDEAVLYAGLGLPFIPPELREDDGEIEAALADEIPTDLVRVEDVQGMVHCHTRYSDGRDSVLDMARGAEALGMRYITITDHSPTASYAGGLSVDRLKRQWEEIDEAQERTGIRIFRGTECDILADGSLDYPDEILERLDVVVASIHNRHAMDEDAMTRRLVRALAHPVFKIWGHARGRLVGRRAPFECRMDDVLDTAAGSRAAIEVNGDPYRLDMDPFWSRRARRRGLRFVISVDAHSVADLRNLRYGVDMARRGWVRRGEVLNALPPDAFACEVRPA